MNAVTVNASRSYQVIIGSNLLNECAAYVSQVKKTCAVAIISDSNVFPLYGEIVAKSLRNAGYQVLSHVFPAGESSKNAETYLNILHFLAKNQFTRSDLILALGGGVVGDLAGFAAATYLRGMDYIQIPTSLLAMVDSSVGGKTAIDIPEGKNLVGAFYQPILVLCDIQSLSTLPEPVFTDGCAEVIKYGVLYDEDLFKHLHAFGKDFHREQVIARCVALKRDVVAADEFDTGARQKLNFGHTVGHAIEKSSNFSITHGHAVAMGMGVVTKAAVTLGICAEDVYDELVSVLRLFGLPYSTNTTAAELYSAALSDKKRSGSSINLVIPQKIGCCILQKTPISQLHNLLESGL